MGEAKRKEQAAQAAGYTPREPLVLSAAESVRVHELQIRADAAQAVSLWAQQQAEVARNTWHREMLRILEEHDIEVSEEEGSWRWNHTPTKRKLTWRFLPTNPTTKTAAGSSEKEDETRASAAEE